MENIGIEYDNNCLKVVFSGEITFDIIQEVKHSLEPHLSREGLKVCIFDMKDVSFLDSSGIGLLISANTRMQSIGISLHLFRPSDQVRKTLDMVQLLNFFKIMETAEELQGLTRPTA